MASAISAFCWALRGVLSAGERAAGRLPPGAVLFLFCAVNCLSYVDRGVIPGAFDALGRWLQGTLGVATADAYIGYLQSAFIVGYSAASLAMGAAVHRVPPFRLMAAGLAVWVAASVAGAAAPSFAALLLARMASGVGEASFQCVVPPWIDDNSPPARRALWLSLFYLNIPVGTALGYALGGFLSAHISWRWMFIAEAVSGRAAPPPCRAHAGGRRRPHPHPHATSPAPSAPR